MKTKGYTLMELLGVMIILGLILLISFPALINQIKKSNDAIDETTKLLIFNSTELYIDNNQNIYPMLSGDIYYVQIQALVDEGLVSENLKDLDVNNWVKVTVNANSTLSFEIVDERPDLSFANDSWTTIAANVKSGSGSGYKVGDTKEVEVSGYGTFTVRVANNSTPEECNTEGFSQTACGFVVEFVDIITNYNMNSTLTNSGGWRDSEMRTFVNNDIYNALPEDLRSVISDTYVVSGHGWIDSSNFTTTDKLYLLSTKEVFGKSGTSNIINYDTAEAETRQLDYYSNLGVSTSNYSGAIKYNSSGSAYYWWLRSAYSTTSTRFYYVSTSGYWNINNADYLYGFAPAFRID